LGEGGSNLAERLVKLGYVNLFMRLDAASADGLWNEEAGPEALLSLSLDESADVEARFLASEILFERRPDFPPDEARRTLGRVYAAALRLAELGNPWGLPGEREGPSGQHLRKIGYPAAEALVDLLGDEREVRYAGSSEATYGNSFGYRVKDIAAFLLSRILGLPYVVKESPEARDKEISKLRIAVKGRKVTSQKK
jgi:hypothetical protein